MNSFQYIVLHFINEDFFVFCKIAPEQKNNTIASIRNGLNDMVRKSLPTDIFMGSGLAMLNGKNGVE